jgi:hypothetical protein
MPDSMLSNPPEQSPKALTFFKDRFMIYKNSKTKMIVYYRPLKQIDFKGASGVIKFFTGNCLSELGIVLKEP